ncbi:hypothetical protein TNCV_1592481 [Trichonephila clavipes]|nr:hypothetical protein TNCV_1592481 [Trichonephila clavipes]
MSSSPVRQKTCGVGKRCTLDLSRAQTSSHWCDVVVKKGGRSSASFAIREKGGNRLVPDPNYMVDAVKLPEQAPRVSGESLRTGVTWRCPDGAQHLFCWPILVSH